MGTLIWIAIAVGIVIAGYGLVQWARGEIAASREGLKSVDRSKLRDMDKDAWAEEEREKEKEKEQNW